MHGRTTIKKKELLVFPCTTLTYKPWKCAALSVRYEIKLYIFYIYNVDSFLVSQKVSYSLLIA
jgi:hypothetical protein